MDRRVGYKIRFSYLPSPFKASEQSLRTHIFSFIWQAPKQSFFLKKKGRHKTICIHPHLFHHKKSKHPWDYSQHEPWESKEENPSEVWRKPITRTRTIAIARTNERSWSSKSYPINGERKRERKKATVMRALNLIIRSTVGEFLSSCLGLFRLQNRFVLLSWKESQKNRCFSWQHFSESSVLLWFLLLSP